MKSYFFLLILVFIACDIEKKTDEIVLKDSNNILKKIAQIFVYCGAENGDCFIAKLNDLFYNLSMEEYTEFTNFRITKQCLTDCVDILSDALKDDSVSEALCSIYVCTN